MKSNGYRTALGGILSALSITVMLLGSIIPFSTYVVPVVASVSVCYFCIEYNKRFALSIYVVITILAIFFVPDKETAFVFTFIFGPYPILKSIFENHTKRLTCWLLKILFFNIEVFITYFLLLKIFISSVLVDEFMGYSSIMLVGLVVAANITFVIFDIVLTRVISLYLRRLRPHLVKKR